MKKLIKIKCLNNNLTQAYPLGFTLKDVLNDMDIQMPYQVLGARVNNQIKELSYQIFKPKTIEFITIEDIDGYRMYQRSLSFVLMKAVRDYLPEVNLKIEHSISRGFYCEVEKPGFKLTKDMVLNIADRMREIIKADFLFVRDELPTQEAIKIFKENRFIEKAELFKNRNRLYTSVYRLDNQSDYFYGYLVPSTAYLKIFDLVPYYDGMLLRFPSSKNPNELGIIIEQEKLFEIFREYKNWAKVLGVSTIRHINKAVEENETGSLIKISEALHEKKVVEIADKVKSGNKKIVLIAGPSSSGKTTFSKRLSVQLKVAEINPVQISLDNYFVDRELTPRDESGEYDFETLEALDIKLFNRNINDLIAGKEIEIPQFSFETGKRYYNGKKLKISDNSVIIVEGIHGLNPQLTNEIPNKSMFKIYVSALTQIGIDSHNRIPTTDNRLLRRIIRDYQYRNYSALETLRRWQSVRRGEDKNIFPFQEEADIMFNSALLFELGVLKKYVEPLLIKINETEREYSEAQRLLKFLSYFQPFPDTEVPPTSILREFLTGSSFNY